MKKIIVTILLVVLLIGTRQSRAVDVDFYSDGVIEDGDVYNVVRIYDTPPDHTTVDMIGGLVDTLFTHDESAVNFSGGYVATLRSYDSSTVNVFGSAIGSLNTYDTSTVSVLTGANVGPLVSHGSSVLHVSGGTINRIAVADSGTANLSGGVVVDNLSGYNSGIINVYGYNLSKTSTGGSYGNGFVTGQWKGGASFNIDFYAFDTYSHINLITVIDAEIDIIPNTLNLASKGKWISCKIWLPEDYNVADIEPNSVVIENEPNDMYPDWIWFNENQNVVMAKCARSDLEAILEPGNVELAVSGFLNDGRYFIGTDAIKVIDKGRKL